MKNSQTWIVILLICLIAIALCSSCNTPKTLHTLPKGLLWSRMILLDGTKTPWIADVEGNSNLLTVYLKIKIMRHYRIIFTDRVNQRLNGKVKAENKKAAFIAGMLKYHAATDVPWIFPVKKEMYNLLNY